MDLGADAGAAKLSVPGRYEILVLGKLGASWSAAFREHGLEVSELTHDGEAVIRLSGSAVDQSALHGALRTIRDLGLLLLSVERLPKTRSTKEEL